MHYRYSIQLKWLAIGLMGLLTTGQALAQTTTLQQRVERLERMADNPVLLQQSQRILEQQREIQALQDEVDRLTRSLNDYELRLQKQYQDMDERINRLETRVVEPAALTVPPVTDAVVTPVVKPNAQVITDLALQPPVATTPAVTSEKAEYDAAFALMRESKYDESISAFEAFAKNHPQSGLASNAYYWLGEGHLIKQNFANAFEAFGQVLKNYPNSNKVEDALLRGADSLVGLNRLDEAKVMYQDLIQRFPNSRAAKSAERRLERFKAGA